LHQYLDDLKHQGTLQAGGLKGVTDGFNQLRSNLTDKAFIIKEALSLYYNLNGMADEINLYSYKKSYLTRLRVSDFYVAVADISQKASALSAALLGIGVTQQQINELATDVDKYYNKIISREKLKENSKGVTASIPEIMRDCRLMLKLRFDRCMNMYANTQSAMVSNYFDCRRLVRSGGRRNYYSVIFSGLVKDKTSGDALQGVAITPETKGKPTVSDEQGKFTLKIYKKDAKALNFALDGYEPLKYMLPEKRIKEHKMQLVVEMQK